MKKNIQAILLLLFCVSFMQGQPKIWNMVNLEDARSNEASEAVKLVIRDADKELSKSILTVTDKTMTPPSGDKHDYMSMGRYWWPNPGTKDGLPYIRKDGVSNPELEKLDRIPLAHMTRSVKILALAFYLTKDDRYVVKAVENIRKWFLNPKTRMNPHLNYGQTIPGKNGGLGRGEGIIDTYSFVEMLEGVELLKLSKRFTKRDADGLTLWFSDYLDWLLNSEIGKEEYEAKNNHGTAFDVQVVRYALFGGKNEVVKKQLGEFAAKRLFKQIEPDGSQPLELVRTTAFGYSTFNLTHIIDMCMMAKQSGYDLFHETSADGRSITKAVEFLIPFLGKQVNEFPYQQIKDWDKVQTDFSWELYRVEKFFQDGRYKNHYQEYIYRNLKNINYLIY